jgi:hypothetical protein
VSSPKQGAPSDGVRHPASYRDPSGFVFQRDGIVFRQINRSFADRWQAFLASGLNEELAEAGLLVSHEEAPLDLALTDEAHAVIRPEKVDFISYPYEWCFSQLKDAALLTLDVQERAIARGMTLRDASAYNVQFQRGGPLLIDTLSFEPAVEGRPWIGYRQFCEHFLAPLALMAYRDVRTGLMLRDFLEGIPLDLAVPLLPGRTVLNFGLLTHLRLHANAQRRAARTDASQEPAKERKVSATGQRALLDSLRRTIEKLTYRAEGTTWSDYTTTTSYADEGARAKAEAVERMLGETDGPVWDLGANVGVFSRIAARQDRRVVALDVDPAAVERNYLGLRTDGEVRILPLLQDLANPSPGLGWELRERSSLVDRAEDGTLLALALVHHLCIGRNVPLPALSAFLARLGRHLILEWVPKSDPMTQRLLTTREDVFADYTQARLAEAFASRFHVTETVPIASSDRTLFLMKRRASDSVP